MYGIARPTLTTRAQSWGEKALPIRHTDGTSSSLVVTSRIMRNKELVDFTIPRRSFVEILKRNESDDEAMASCYELALSVIIGELSSEEDKLLRLRLRTVRSLYKAKFKRCSSKPDRFESCNVEWLNGFFKVSKSLLKLPNAITSDSSVVSSHQSTKRQLEYEEMSSRSKRRAVADLSKSHSRIPKQKLLLTTSKIVKNSGDTLTAAIIKETTKSPGRPLKMIRKLRHSSILSNPYSPEEALAVLLDLNLSKRAYAALRAGAISHGYDLYPAYSRVLKEKDNCHPPQQCFTVTDTFAAVSLSSLLQHTVQRILLLQKEVIVSNMDQENKSVCGVKLICTWGFDGTSGQANYKQRYDTTYSTELSDSCLFATTLIPLRLVTMDGTIYWQNPIPQLVRFCISFAGIRLQFIKESENVILSEKAAVEKEISTLTTVLYTIDDVKSLNVTFDLHLTIIDGKVLNAITGTKSAQTCPLCGAKPTQFNKLDNIGQSTFQPKLTHLKYGVSPLHAWIRFLEFCLHLSYRLEIKVWRVSKPGDKILFQRRKKYIQDNMLKRMNLRVDFPTPGGSGSSNDRNTARRAFRDYKTFADVLQLDENFVKSLQIILITLSSQFEINPEKFGNYCRQVAVSYVEMYPFFYMSATVHKILIHGEDIIRHSVLPLGMMGEDAGESKNKMYRQDRQFHARKCSRRKNLYDVFSRGIDCSDPVISSVSLNARRTKCKRLPLPTDVISLLQAADEPVGLTPVELEETQFDETLEEEYDFDDMDNTYLERENDFSDED